MIDQRFARDEFEKLEYRSSEADDLHKALASEIAAELHISIEPTFRAIADRLRELGHHLEGTIPEYDPEFYFWGYEYYDPSNDQALRIWLHTQLGAISGYRNEARGNNDKV